MNEGKISGTYMYIICHLTRWCLYTLKRFILFFPPTVRRLSRKENRAVIIMTLHAPRLVHCAAAASAARRIKGVSRFILILI